MSNIVTYKTMHKGYSKNGKKAEGMKMMMAKTEMMELKSMKKHMEEKSASMNKKRKKYA